MVADRARRRASTTRRRSPSTARCTDKRDAAAAARGIALAAAIGSLLWAGLIWAAVYLFGRLP